MRIPEQRILAELRQAPEREAIGVVGPWGANIGRAGDQPYTLRIDFEYWKLKDSGLMRHQICICRQGAFEEFKPVRGSIKPYGTLRVRAHVPESALLSATYALLVEIVGEDSSDDELVRIAQHLREPVIVEDAPFGSLTLDRRLKWFEGTATWCSKPVLLRLKVDDDVDPGPALEIAHRLWGSELDWNRRICDFAASDLLELSNHWRQSEDEAITEQTFRSRLKLDAVTVSPDGKFECWFDPDGMFTDHAVRVTGSLSKGPTFAGIEG